MASFDRWEEDTGDDEGWGRYNRSSWLRDFRGFAEFFFGEMTSEPHSTKLFEDFLNWSETTDGETLVRAHPGVRLAQLTGGSLRTLEGSGHAPHARDPVATNRVLDEVLAAATRPGVLSSR